jgi:YVTN family beta-propeller protein
MERFFIDDIADEDGILRLDIRNIESKSMDYKAWNKLAGDLLDRGNYYTSLYEKSKSGYAKSKLESIYDKSIAFSDKSLELNSENMNSWYNKGVALSNLGRYDDAIKCYDRVIEINPSFLHVWDSKGNALIHLRKFQEAIKCYERVLEIDPNNIIAYYNKGLALRRLGKYQEAIMYYDKVIKTDPTNIDVLIAKGYALERLGKLEEAIICYDKVMGTDPKNTEALNAKGLILERRGKYEEAEQYYNRVAEEYSNEINSMNEKAIHFQKLDKYEEAIICYDRIISIDANNIDAWLNKGLSLYKLDKYEEAIKCYDRVISIDTNNVDALNAKGLALEKLGDYDNAIQIFDIVIAQNQNYVVDTLIKKGHILMVKENYSEAEKCYHEALRRDSNNLSALSELQLLYSNYTFQYEKAIEVNKLLSENLSNQETKRDNKLLLAQNLINSGKYSQGRKVAKEVIKYLPDQAIIKRGIARSLVLFSYLLEGKKFDGIEELEKFLVYYSGIDIDHFKIEETQWNFKGLNNVISKNKKIDHPTKTILHNLIDLLRGTDLHNIKDSQKTLSKIAEKSSKEAERMKIRKKIIQTSIIAVIAMAALGFLYVNMTDEANPCSLPTSQTLPVGNNPLGIDFNPKTNKAYITNEKDRTVSVLDCNVPNYSPYLKYLNMNTDTTPKVEASIPLDYPPFDIAVDPETNKIYVLHQSPFPSVSVIDGKNNVKLNNSISVGINPLDIAVNPTTHKVYVVNFGSNTLSVINSTNQIEKEIRDVGKKPFSVDVNPNTNKIYITNEGSNNVLVINETKEKDNRKFIPLPYLSEDIEVNPTTNKVYVTHRLNNSISIINGVNDDSIKTIDVGKNPISVDAGYNTKEVFVVNRGSNSLSIIDGSKDTVIKTLKIAGDRPYDIEINPQIKSAYITNNIGNFRGVVNVIKYEENEDYKYIQVGNKPIDIAVNPTTKKVYVVNNGDGNVSVINGTTDEWIKDIGVGNKPVRIDIDMKTHKIYVTNNGSNNVSVINGTTDEWIKDIDVVDKPISVAVNPNTKKVYVGYSNSHELSVINSIDDTLLIDKNGEEVKIGFNYRCPSDIAVNLDKNQLYVSFDCRDGIFLVNDEITSTSTNTTNDEITSTSTKITTLGKSNTHITFNPVIDKIYVLDTESNLVYTTDASELQ